MFLSKVPSIGTCIGSVATIYSFSNSVKADDSVCHDCSRLGKRLPKARELPIYSKKEDDFFVEYDKKSELPLINEISSIRLQLSGIVSYLNVFKKEAVHVYETGLAHSQIGRISLVCGRVETVKFQTDLPLKVCIPKFTGTLEYITNEENQIPRIITITSAGLVGVLLARRGGYIKKVLYGSIGSGIAFSAFYPSTAKEYFSSGFEYTKHHTSNALEKYGGYDTKKISEDANEKLDRIKGTLKLEGLTAKMKEWFEKNKEKASKTLKDAAASVNSKDEPSKPSN